jgi:asparagine synthase (glutamine-hydrolysing)
MCGIAGIAARSPSTSIGPTTFELTRSLAHRGPDGEGFWLSGPSGSGLVGPEELRRPASVVLGSRRLSIIDLPGGSQPMSNEDGSVWTVYNGEIYNHADLRDELGAAGHEFRTRADTEVLVHGWEEWGTDLFPRLNGIFAFALHDCRSDETWLVRDPLGVKPLYLGVNNGRTWWSSELASAIGAGLATPEPDPDGAKLFLTFRFVPSPSTLVARAWKVPPSHFVRVRGSQRGNDPRFERYETRVRSTREPETTIEWREAVIDELEQAVTRQLMSDVPVASMLSGGVDSSLMTQMMMRHLPYAPVTFGIGMAGDTQSEALASQRAAALLGAPHDSTVVGNGDYVTGWPEALGFLGEPIANTSLLMVQLLCVRVGMTHKVILSGQGADEPLGGYTRHLPERFRPLGDLPLMLGERAVRFAGKLDDARRLRRFRTATNRVDRYAALLAIFDDEEVDELLPQGTPARELARAAIVRWLQPEEQEDTLNEFLRVDARMSLADDLLIVADHFAMRSSVELRVPFLDLGLVELIERMPARYKVSALGRRKWLYREGAARRLPESLAKQLAGPLSHVRSKRGFSTPHNEWFVRESEFANYEAWAPSLIEAVGMEDSAVARALRPGAKGNFGRRRATLYSLATWASKHL